LWGYEAEEHIVQTKDGFLLGVHRLQWRKGEERQKVNNGPTSIKKRVVYLHHGLLMNSEVWVCLTDEQRCLPFELVERGFDVWVRRLPYYTSKVSTLLITLYTARQQSRKQVFQEIDSFFSYINEILGLLYG
jgi:hypothetical protein